MHAPSQIAGSGPILIEPSENGGAHEPGLYGKRLAFPLWRVYAARLVSLIAVGTGAAYLHWRLSTVRGTGLLGGAFYAAEALNYSALLLAVFLFWRVRWRTGPPAGPFGTLDVFLPVAGEPVEMVEETLKAALAIRHPHRTYILNDGRMIGKKNWQEIEELADRYGVPCFTRTTGTLGKGGNLNYGLERTDGDFVLAIDADHRAHQGLAHETLGYFVHDDVGFVSWPQQFEGHRSDFLNNRELLYFRYMAAAKDADNAIQTYGNGLYRRAALESIGGFSEWVRLCEDMHSSYRMEAMGWKGVYHPRAVTTGLAPQTAAALVKQRMTWATDSLKIFFRDNPLLKRGLGPRQRLHYLQTTSHYLTACTQVLFVLGPVLWLLWQIPLMRPRSNHEYLVHILAYLGSLAVWMAIYGGIRGGLRVIQATLFLAPVYFLAVLRVLTRLRVRATVTEKVRPRRFSFLLLPQQGALALNVAAVGFALWNNIPARGLVAAWAGYMVFTLAGFLTVLGERRWVNAFLRAGVRGPIIAAVAVTLFLPPLGGPGGIFGHRYVLAAPAHGAYVGFFDPDLLKRQDPVRLWSRSHGTPPAIVHWFQQWFGAEPDFRRDWVDNADQQDVVPMITWEPWAGASAGATGRSASLSAIASGAFDDYVRSWARGAAAYGRPILLRPMPLMNGPWFPWSAEGRTSANRDFVRAWRHLHDIFVQQKATNVSWVWAINSVADARQRRSDLAAFYPGSRFVDWVSMSGFNWGRAAEWSTWQSFDEVFGDTYASLLGFDKPVMVAEIATVANGGDQQAWVRDALKRVRLDYPMVKALVWHETRLPEGVDFHLRGDAAAAFRQDVSSSPYWRPLRKVVAAPVAGASKGSDGILQGPGTDP